MRLVLAVAPVLLLACVALQAQEPARTSTVRQLANTDVQVRRDAVSRLAETGTTPDLAALFESLRDADEGVRQGAEQAIWRIWSRSGDPKVDALFETGMGQIGSGDLDDAIATFSRIIAMKPDFAEGWNKRATLYFLAGDLRRSLADCEEVIKRNPRHFGVLAGYAQIYAQLEYYDRALDYSRRALAVNPNLDGVRRNIEMLERLVDQRRKQMI